jgi:hypothetical protein
MSKMKKVNTLVSLKDEVKEKLREDIIMYINVYRKNKIPIE